MIRLKLHELRHFIAKEMKLLSEDDRYKIGVGKVFSKPSKKTLEGIKQELKELQSYEAIVAPSIKRLKELLEEESDAATIKELEEMLNVLKPVTATFAVARYHGSKILAPHRVG